ncbi:MAG: Txe/YoeB family addiction module toxin [Bacilli bacterium]|nr:Txe/YoeB family addiction module toxin [Bacilli bacterium]
MVMWTVKFTAHAEQDKKKLAEAGLEKKAKQLLDVLSLNPFQNSPRYEKLVGNLEGYYSRRINMEHRLVYRVLKDQHLVIVHSMESHYESMA